MGGRIHIRVITGPTAGGKSAYALDQAIGKNAVIFNADCMQMYAGLPLLTAQPDAQAQAMAAHRLYGVWPVGVQGNAGAWTDVVCPLLREYAESGAELLVVGGTGLYIKALVEGLSTIPPVSEDIRAHVRDLARQMDGGEFYRYVLGKDPAAAGTLKPQDRQRLGRALEVMLATGKSITTFQGMKTPPLDADFTIEVIMPPREELDRRIRRRTHIMLEEGIIDEAREFLATAQAQNSPLQNALGLKEIAHYLECQSSTKELADAIALKTRQYAKRQCTWIRGQILPLASGRITIRPVIEA